MTTQLRIPAIPRCMTFLAVLLAAGPLAAQQAEAERARVPVRLEIDRSALLIDMASQRRFLDADIRKALGQPVSAGEAVRVATSAARPIG